MLSTAPPPADTEVVKRWLADALKGRPPGYRALLAKHCDVKPQAVNGWLKTGRISKTSLQKAIEYLQSAPHFGGAPLRAKEPTRAAGRPTWRFELLDLDLINALPVADLYRLEGAWMRAAADLGLHVAKRAAA